jgi:tetratricopeptide (TPR) repeat protein
MFYNRGSRAEATGDWQRAVESYQEAVRLKPDFLVAHMNLGYVLLRLNRYDEALEAFRSAARIDPRHPGPLLNIGNVYYTRQDYESALGYYRQAVTLKPDYATGYYQMGLALGRLGRLAKSKAVFERALELNPSDAAARKSLGEVERAMATHP